MAIEVNSQDRTRDVAGVSDVTGPGAGTGADLDAVEAAKDTVSDADVDAALADDGVVDVDTYEGVDEAGAVHTVSDARLAELSEQTSWNFQEGFDLQTALSERGHDVGPLDGYVGEKTLTGLADYDATRRKETVPAQAEVQGPYQTPDSRIEELVGQESRTEAETLELQTALENRGYELGPLDGVEGPRTRSAMSAYTTDRENAAKASEILDTMGIPTVPEVTSEVLPPATVPDINANEFRGGMADLAVADDGVMAAAMAATGGANGLSQTLDQLSQDAIHPNDNFALWDLNTKQADVVAGRGVVPYEGTGAELATDFRNAVATYMEDPSRRQTNIRALNELLVSTSPEQRAAAAAADPALFTDLGQGLLRSSPEYASVVGKLTSGHDISLDDALMAIEDSIDGHLSPDRMRLGPDQ